MKHCKLALIFSFLFYQFAGAGVPQRAPTSAAECTSVDLRDQSPSKIRNQNGLSWCYAFASADLLQYIYQLPQPISAADIAITYNDLTLARIIHGVGNVFSSHRNEPQQTGLAKFALDKMTKEGYCLEENLPSDFWLKQFHNGQTQSVTLMDAFKDIVNLQKQIQTGLYKREEELPFIYVFPATSTGDFYSILKSSNSKSVLRAIRDYACSSSRKEFPQSFRYNMSLKQSGIFQRVNADLNRRLPVVFDFFSEILYDLNRVNFNKLHTVLLYGRKFDSVSGECVYLVKNSHGEDCSPYDSKIPCENGYLWLRESTLYKSMTSIVRSTF